MINELKTILHQVGRNTHHLEKEFWWEKNKKLHIYLELNKLYPFTYTIREAIYLKMNNMTERPKCHCGNEIKPPKEKVLNGFVKHCSRTCQVITQQKNIDFETKRKRNSKAGKISHQNRNPKTLIYRQEYYIEQYGSIDGIIKYNEFLIKPTFSKDICIEKNGVEEGLKLWRKRQQKWQYSINSKSDDELKKINMKKDSWSKLSDNDRKIRVNKLQKTMYEKGLWYDWQGNDCYLFYDFEYYSKMVRMKSENQNLKILLNNEKRGKIKYHLDHKYSIAEGFKNNIPTHIIASIHNLEFIPFKENCSKRDKCSITIEELFRLFF